MPPSDISFDLNLAQGLGVAAAYVLGCFNTGYYLVRWKTGRDLRQLGSGTAGAKNTGRVLGRWGFAAVLFGDMAKGALAVGGAQVAGFSPFATALVILAVIAGHNWPVQLGGRGGKGVAVSCGALLVADPVVLGAMLGLCALLVAVTRRFTAGTMAAYAGGPLFAALLERGPLVIALFAAAAGLVVGPHWRNLREELSRRQQIKA